MLGVIRKRKGKNVYFIDGKEVTKRTFERKLAQARPDYSPKEEKVIARPRGMKRGYPIKSAALAVHPTQVQEAQDDSVKKGVPTQFTPGGRPILRDTSHRRKYLKAYNFVDRNSFNGY